MIKSKLARFALLAGLAMSAPASATSVIDGACVDIASAAGCKFETNINTNTNGNSSYLLAQAAFNTYNNTHPNAGSDIVLNPIFAAATINGNAGSTAGSWALPGFLVDFVAVKAGDNFILYKITPAASGNWTTNLLTNKKGEAQALSHMVFFGAPGAVPEPATWAMMLGGFGLIGAAARRRQRTSVTFA